MDRYWSRAVAWVSFAALGLLTAGASGQTLSQPSSGAEDGRIARLTGMCRLWGTVKFFHPYLAYRPIDWDRALVESIPMVDAARTPQEYAAAINRLLAALGDRATRAEVEDNEDPGARSRERGAVDTPGPVLLGQGILRVDGWRLASLADEDTEAYDKSVAALVKAAPSARGFVLDLRRQPGGRDESDAFYLDRLLSGFVEHTLPGSLTYATRRYRTHSGYPPQSGITSGGYYSGFAYATPRTIVGGSTSPARPIVLIVSGDSSAGLDLASGLQGAGLGRVVLDGSASATLGATTHSMSLPDGVQAHVRTSELVGLDGRIGLEPDVVVAPSDVPGDAAMERALSLVRDWSQWAPPERPPRTAEPMLSDSDNPYPEMAFPSREYRLLALFRFWNIIDLFFPYKPLLDQPWDGVLPRYIPQFEGNTNAAAYQRTVVELVTELQDSHSSVAGLPANERWYPPFNVRNLEGQTVVDFVLKEARGLRLWDVVLAVDGQPIADYRRERSRTIAAATPQSLQVRLHRFLFRGEKDSRLRLVVRGLDGKSRDVTLSRSVAWNDPRWEEKGTGLPAQPIYGVLPSGFGYADLRRLENSQVDAMFAAIAAADAVIFDMRGYPRGTAWSIAPRLTDRSRVVGARFSRPLRQAIALGEEEYSTGSLEAFDQLLPPRRGDVYRGRVVVLIDATAISQAEHSCLFYEAATPVTFIGMPTAGTNGDVTNMVLPGGLSVGFTGHDVRHADGRQLQRIGIQPTIRVEPTLRGYSEGRDEILEAAVEFLTKK